MNVANGCCYCILNFLCTVLCDQDSWYTDRAS